MRISQKRGRKPRAAIPPMSWMALWLLLLFSASCSLEPPLETLGMVPPFELTREDGTSFSSESLKGKVWVIDFIFTRCAGPCPRMSTQMKALQKTFAEEPGVHFVSVSADPVADSPPVLRAYAQKYEANPERWTFLTGEVMPIYELIEKGFRLGAGPPPDPAKVGPGDLIIHSTRFTLVDKTGAIRGTYQSEDPGFHEAVTRAIHRLL